MAEPIRKGDVVVLKSGGPAMTVEAIREGRAFCVWFVDLSRFCVVGI